MPEVTPREWREFINERPDPHLLQSAEWGELKAAFGWEPVRLISDGVGAQVLFRRLPLGLSIAYIPKPAFDLTRAASGRFWQELLGACRKRRAILLKIEPDGWERPASGEEQTPPWPVDRPPLRRSAFNIQPPRTLVVDVRGAEDEILARMKQKCRYNIRLAEKKGVSVRPWADIAAFHALIRVTGGRDGFAVHSLDYYRRAYDLFYPQGACELLLAEHAGQPLAALMVFRRGARAWYLYGASNDLERNRMPTYLLQWEALRWAKGHGAQEYDLWGVPDEDEATLEANFEKRKDGLWGVYRFKRGFGGELRRAPQARDVVFNPLLYRLYLWRMGAGEAA